MELRAPFPYFGGKRKVTSAVWQRFGAVDNYVEPFFGSGAVLFGRPDVRGVETVSDLDGYVANAWRAMRADPDAVAEHAHHPVNENDLHARHAWLVRQRDTLRERLEGDPDFYDAKIAGWWIWGMSCWIGSGFCSGKGPWRVEDGRLVRAVGEEGVNRQRVHLGNDGQGVKRQRVHLGDDGQGDRNPLVPWFHALAKRLERVRVCSGDWSRVCGKAVTYKHGLTAVFLDPPYSAEAGRDGDLYSEEDLQVAHAVREWAIEAGKRPDLRVALCGYEGEHEMPPDWSVYAWNAGGGYGSQAEERSGNGRRERIWFSPACLPVLPRQVELFGVVA